jgi:hypothetical protein
MRTLILFALLSFAGTGALAGTECGLKGSVTARIASCALPVENGGMGVDATRHYIYIPDDELNDPLGGLDVPELIWRLVAQNDEHQIWRNDYTTQLWINVGYSLDDQRMTEESQNAACVAAAKRLNLKRPFRVPTKAELELAFKQQAASVLRDYSKGFFVTAGAQGEREIYNSFKGVFVPEADSIVPFSLLCVAGEAKVLKRQRL